MDGSKEVTAHIVYAAVVALRSLPSDEVWFTHNLWDDKKRFDKQP